VEHGAAEYVLHVLGAREGDDITMRFDPKEYIDCELQPLRRPKFLAIVSSNTLALTMLKKANGRVDGLVMETCTAGGHNAPPRGKLVLSDIGEPVYGERDAIDFSKLRELGVPFWLAGGYGQPHMVAEALAHGAAGVQVGTAFEFARESGLDAEFKGTLLAKVIRGDARVFTDPLASPTGFPFKVARLEGTVSESEEYSARPRICDLGFLREAYRKDCGSVGYRCAAEPVTVYVSKGGKQEDTVGRKCVCNGLLANIGLAQVRNGNRVEPPLITAGDDIVSVGQFVKPGRLGYCAADVVKRLMSGVLADDFASV
jgi:nitronate monooxygenase